MLNNKHSLRRRLGKVLGTILLLASCMYGLHNIGAFGFLSDLFNRTGFWAFSSLNTWRLQVMAGEVKRSQQSIAELREQYQIIVENMNSLKSTLEQENRILSDEEGKLEDLLTGLQEQSAGNQRDQVLTETLRRVDHFRQRCQACDNTMANLRDSGSVLLQRISQAEEILAGQIAELHRQQSQFAGDQAFSRGLQASQHIMQSTSGLKAQ